MMQITEEHIQIKVQRLEGLNDQVRVSIVDETNKGATGKSICMDPENAAHIVGQLYQAGRQRGARISLEVGLLPLS